jgi:hypothetical protein
MTIIIPYLLGGGAVGGSTEMARWAELRSCAAVRGGRPCEAQGRENAVRVGHCEVTIRQMYTTTACIKPQR